MAKLHNKRLPGLDSYLSTKDIRWTSQGVLYLHLKLHFEVLTPVRFSTDNYPLINYLMFANTTLLNGAGIRGFLNYLYPWATCSFRGPELLFLSKRIPAGLKWSIFSIVHNFMYNAHTMHTVYCY